MSLRVRLSTLRVAALAIPRQYLPALQWIGVSDEASSYFTGLTQVATYL